MLATLIESAMRLVRQLSLDVQNRRLAPLMLETRRIQTVEIEQLVDDVCNRAADDAT
jgi:hypothetical protein